jgi:peptidoglycan/LPS O-acetylase OafA/YrhL
MLEKIYSKFRRITSNQKYIPEVDGMRFLCLFLVILCHTRGYFLEKTTIDFADKNVSYYWLNKFLDNASRSIPMFFAISGFIVCLPFARHYINGDKKIYIKPYFIRRITRMEPPYFVVLTTVFIAQILLKPGSFHTMFPSFLASFIYSHGFIFHHTPLVSVVFWTLEVDVQYYILAPFLFKLLALPTVTRRVLSSALIVIFVTLQHYYPPQYPNLYGFIQYFIIGIMLGDFYTSGFMRNELKSPWLAVIPITIFLSMFYLPISDYLALQIAFPFMIGIFYIMMLRNELLVKIFSYKFIPIIGGMCYTIYLLHYTVISMVGRFAIHVHLTRYYLPNLFLQLILLSVPILIISAIFYLFIERSFMSKKWMDKLLGRNTPKAETAVAYAAPAEEMNSEGVKNG